MRDGSREWGWEFFFFFFFFFLFSGWKSGGGWQGKGGETLCPIPDDFLCPWMRIGSSERGRAAGLCSSLQPLIHDLLLPMKEEGGGGFEEDGACCCRSKALCCVPDLCSLFVLHIPHTLLCLHYTCSLLYAPAHAPPWQLHGLCRIVSVSSWAPWVEIKGTDRAVFVCVAACASWPSPLRTWAGASPLPSALAAARAVVCERIAVLQSSSLCFYSGEAELVTDSVLGGCLIYLGWLYLSKAHPRQPKLVSKTE